MRKEKYAPLQLKRAGKIYPHVLIITILTLCAVLLVGTLALGNFMGGEDKKKFNIGIVGDITDSYLGVGIEALKNVDSSRYSIVFSEMGEEEALQALEDGAILGYVKVPDNFIDGIVNGENVPATFVTYGGPEGFGSIMTAEVTKTVSEFVTECQRALYAMQDLAFESDETEDIWDKTKVMNIEYIDFVLSRNKTYEVEHIGIADAISMGGYYICGITVFFLLLLGISAGRFFTEKNRELDRQLYARGLGVCRQVLCEYLAYVLMLLVTVFILALVAGFVLPKADFGIQELEGATFLTPIGFCFVLLPVILLIGAMQQFLYETTQNTVAAILLQFLAAIGMGYLCGCLYPITFFPVPLQKFGAVLPAGVGFSFLRQSLVAVPDGRTWLQLLGYTALFPALTALIRKRRMAGDGR